ncbi:MAG: hypothetical protein K2N95_03810 [Lachnospiraceae bacterium]|nr:hypothetical protein [Lachnospiraceae bacterium]
MRQYTYTLNPNQIKEENHTYKQSELEKMTVFRLQEICRKERLVIPSAQRTDREGLIRLIMRFRGQKEYRHIQDACEDGMERIQDFLDRCGVQFLDEPRVSIPGTITLYQNTEMNELDGYQVEADEQLLCGNLLLVDEDLMVYTCFYLDEIDGNVYLFKGKDVPVRTLEKHQFSILYFPDVKTSEFLYDCYHGKRVSMPGYMESVRIPLLDIQEKEIQQADLPLVIDFGSCNTTMGICLPDGSTKIAAAGGSAIIPSIIGIREKAGGGAEILSGHHARMADSQDYQDGDVAVFYDIKRWISDADRVENVILKNGYKYQFSRREMLRAYLDYLLDLAQQQFKCSFTSIQLLAPIRQKQKFQKVFKELLPEYRVNCELDEGMAVMFHSINGLIRGKKYEERRWYHALVLDCGGGTTDLTSGRFCIENNRVSYIIDLETRYENGDTNFGGNNLTYRILQLLKLRIVEEIGLGQPEAGKPVCEGIQEWYDRAEEWLPTRFKEYEEKSREQYFLVKNNYYYLFGIAEQIKKQFFRPEFSYQIVLSTVKGEGIFLDKWKLSLSRGNQMVYPDQPVRFSVYRNEIEELLRPDIYSLMEQFLDQKFEQGELMEYEMIKLTGQSCKSQLFLEALKQYVPGKRIQGTKQDAAGTELKMCCLEGALAYFMNCKLGYMKVNEKYRVGSLPYEIMAFTHENREKILIKSLDAQDHIGHISRFHIGNQLDLYLNDGQGRRLKTYYFRYDTSKFEETTQEAIDTLYAGTVIQEQTDIILEGEMKFFVWISRERWGFVVLPVLRDQEHLYKGQETFFDFEDDTWELNYFDGRK